MRLYGNARFIDNGMTANLRTMHLQTEILGIHNQNIMGFDKIGYQRKEAVLSSFAEILGVHALSTAIDDKVGRVVMSDSPLDLTIATKGYFQVEDADGIKMTRDGRFKLNEKGDLLNLNNAKVLSNGGVPIKLPFYPEKMTDIKIDTDGNVNVFNKKTNKLEYIATVSVVSTEGMAIINPDIKQGYNEHSNVSMENEFMEIMPIQRNFDANRQLFMMQNSTLSKAISELGRA